MKFTIECAEFARAMSVVIKSVERRNTIPILSNIKLTAEPGTLELVGTDLDIKVSTQVPILDLDAAGATTVSAQLLHDIVRKFPEGSQIAVEMNDSVMVMKSGRSRFKLNTIPADDFPDIKEADTNVVFSMSSGDVVAMIDQVAFAISTEETRYYLNGVYLHVDNGKMIAVATDGHRLSKLLMAEPDGAAAIPGVIIPRKTVQEIHRLAKDTKAEEIQFAISQSQIRATMGRTVLTSKLIDGSFPDYNRVIPTGNDKRAIIDRVKLQKAVDLISTVSSERGRAVKLSFADNLLTLSVNNPDHGDAVEEMEIEWSSDPLEIGFNARYLLDILGTLDADQITVDLDNPGSPTLLRNAGESGADIVLMPTRL